jgi:hypothetical protein
MCAPEHARATVRACSGRDRGLNQHVPDSAPTGVRAGACQNSDLQRPVVWVVNRSVTLPSPESARFGSDAPTLPQVDHAFDLLGTNWSPAARQAFWQAERFLALIIATRPRQSTRQSTNSPPVHGSWRDS